MGIIQITQIIDDVCRAKADLIELRASVTPDRLKLCASTVANLENYVAEILGTEWVPSDRGELTKGITRACQNNRWMQEHVDAAIDAVLISGEPDEFFRVRMALMFCRIADHQLQVMMDVLAELLKSAPQSEYVN